MEEEDEVGAYVQYTEEQKEAANAVPICAILDKEGESYKRRGKEFQWIRHDSLIFSGSKWFRYSEGQGGQAISFCKKFLNMTFAEAMEYLLEFCPSASANPKENEKICATLPETKVQAVRQNTMERFQENTKENSKENMNENTMESRKEITESTGAQQAGSRELVLPERNETMKCVYWYLIGKRHIDKTILSYFVREDMIYEEAKGHGVVFLGRDPEGKVRHAHVRGTKDTERGKFRMTVEGSDSRYGFGHAGAGNILYAFEAPIDLLSFLCLYPKDWKKNSYITLNGVCGNAIFQFLKEHPAVDSVVLCLDSDKAGEKACLRLTGELKEAGFCNVRRLRSSLKDWNEDLLQRAEENREWELEMNGKGESTCSLQQC